MRRLFDKFLSTVRTCVRVIWIAGELTTAAVLTSLFQRQRPGSKRVEGGAQETPTAYGGRHGAEWLHKSCRRLLRVFSPQLRIDGDTPTRGLLVANHLGYFDIILLSALTPCVFVSKSEVRSWPVFGWFARSAGTIFITRTSRRDVLRATGEIRAALSSGVLVVLFPEGTSSDGSSVLPFKSSLLASISGDGASKPATLPSQTRSQIAARDLDDPFSVFAAALHYELPDGNAAEEVCYWGEHTLAPHLLRLLSKRCVHISAAFVEIQGAARDRKILARQLHGAVSHLHAGLRTPAAPAPPAATAAPFSPAFIPEVD